MSETTMLDFAGLGLAKQILNEARSMDIELRLSVLVLRLPDQSERVVTYYSEFGDGDGRQRAEELMREMTPMLNPGEVLHVTERVVP